MITANQRIAVFLLLLFSLSSARCHAPQPSAPASDGQEDHLSGSHWNFPLDDDSRYVLVNTSVANLRVKPAFTAGMATQALIGRPLKVLDEQNGWYYVETPDMYKGWIFRSVLYIPEQQDSLRRWVNAPKVIYLAHYGQSYDAPDKRANAVSDLTIGSILTLLEVGNTYYKVSYPDLREAYIHKSEAHLLDNWLKSRAATSDSIVNTAKRFMGVPYLWGGTSAKAFDCSGFTQMVYFLHGIVLPRDAWMQEATGIAVEEGIENLQKGDLLFFGIKAQGGQKERIKHVAVYIGNNEYIHASGMVRINSLDPKARNFSQRRYDQYLRAKRILGSLGKNGIMPLENTRFVKVEDGR